MTERSGGQLVVDALVAQGVSTVFGVPGESYLTVLDALHDTEVRYLTCRQEGGAAYMAEAWGKLTGEPGVCMVTRGPGATNASVGVHTAMQDSTPMLLLVGQVSTGRRGREAFQEIDYRHFFGSIAKWVVEVARTDDLADALTIAFKIAVSGRPGPVVVALPEDVLTASTAVVDVTPLQVERATPAVDEIDTIIEELGAAERPVMIVGGGRWTIPARRDLEQFAEANTIAVVTAFRFHDLIDNFSDVYVGEAGVWMSTAVQSTIRDADLIVGLGIRFGQMTTGAWSLLDLPTPSQRVVHVHPERIQLGRIYSTEVGVLGDPSITIAMLRDRELVSSPGRSGWVADRRAAYLESMVCPPQPGGVDMGEVMAWLQAELPPDAIITNGAGNFTVWPSKFFRYGPDARLLAPQSGTMGYGLPAAIAAKAAHPDRTVVCFAGDGDLQMTIQELATARQAGCEPIVIVVDNQMYGTIRTHQERVFPERVSGTDLVNPDFVMLAAAHGMHSERVATTGDFAPAFARAAASPTGALLHIRVDPSRLTPFESITDVRGRPRPK